MLCIACVTAALPERKKRREGLCVSNDYHIQGKITECWLAETEGIFSNHDSTFGNIEGMITGCWLAQYACIKLVSRFKQLQTDFEKEFQKRFPSEFDLNTAISS